MRDDTPSFRAEMMPPCCMEAEEAIIGGILFDPNAIARVIDSLPREAFFYAAHAQIYTAAQALARESKPTDLINVMTWLSDRGKLESLGGQTALLRIMSSTVSAVNIEGLANLVMEKFVRRQLMRVANEIAQSAYSPDSDIDTILDTAQAKLFELRKTAFDGQQLEHISDVVVRVVSNVEQLNQGEEAMHAFLPTGFYDLDALAHGLPIGYPTICAGRPGTGKTTLGIELALHVALSGMPVAFFSLEMSREDICKKILARMSSPSLRVENFFASNSMPQPGWETLFRVAEEASGLPIWINDKSTMTPGDIRADLRMLQAGLGELGLVVVDYVGLMKSNTKAGNRVLELDDILRELRAIAKDFNVALVGLAQINRGVESRSDKRPTLSDIRESGAYEQEGALVLSLYNDAYYNSNSPDRGIAEIGVLKNRFGSTGMIKLVFQPEYGAFRNMARC